MHPLSKRIQNIPQSATVRIADLAKRLKHQGIDIVDFSAGRAAEHSPDYVNQSATKAIMEGDTHQTMARGTLEFRKACARKLERENGISVDPETSVIATLGCKQGLTLALMAIVDLGDEIIVEDPCFVSYKPLIEISGGIPVPVPLLEKNHFRWTGEDLELAITERTRAILFCSPQNPTGAVHSESDLERIVDLACRHDLFVIVDETYERLTWKGRQHISIATRPGMKERTISLLGLTKAFSMGGWRIGFSHGPEAVISAMVKLQQHLVTCAGSFTQKGAARALMEELPVEVQNLWKDWEKRCYFVPSELDQLPNITCEPPEGGFYAWINIRGTGYGSEDLAKTLLEKHHIALIPGVAFGSHGEGYLRMTCVRSWEDLHKGLARLKKALA